ncbi:MAG: histidine kinase dimerization/phospho-acceptor domain-containing protein, partial [Verrucomicrobiota bacterium]
MKSLQLQLKEGKIRWVILVASFLIAIVALAWVTERAVGLEEQHREDEASARLRERVRLALWRMEAEASQVVVRESLRPALHYEIGEPEPSPLLESAPELVKLHFQCFPAGSTAGLCSPQAPPEASDPESVAEANQRMSDLRQLLRSDTEWEELTGFELLAISGKTGITQIRNRHDDVIPVVATDAWASADQEQREESLITQPIRETRALDQSPASPMKPVWLNEELVLIRRVDDDRGPRMQGVWLDWEALEHRLLRSASDLFPEARLEPIRSTEARDHWRALVSLPLRLEPGPLAISSTRFPAGFATGLGLAWICLLGTFVAISFVLLKTEQLSQRRAAFVSAVTHELRTPMTTFRLYSEMLADDAVTDQADRRHYLNTLCTESDRLMRLIENVLAFSGIENRKSSGRIPIPLNLVEEVEKWFPKLSEQCEAAGLQLEFS